MNKKEIRKRLFKQYDGRCAYCGNELESRWHIDHIKAVRRHEYGGCMFPDLMNDEENMLPACASCNINKHSLSVEEFRNLIAGFMKHLNERNTQYKIAKRYNLIQETENKVKFYFETNSPMKIASSGLD